MYKMRIHYLFYSLGNACIQWKTISVSYSKILICLIVLLSYFVCFGRFNEHFVFFGTNTSFHLEYNKVTTNVFPDISPVYYWFKTQFNAVIRTCFKSLFAYKIRLYFIIKRNSFPWYKKIFKQILIHPLPIKNLNLKVWNERKAYEHSRLDISFHFRLLMKKQCIFCRNPTKNKNVSTFSYIFKSDRSSEWSHKLP